MMHTTFVLQEEGEGASSRLCLLAGCCASYKIFPIIWGLAVAVALPPMFGWSYFIPDTSGIR